MACTFGIILPAGAAVFSEASGSYGGLVDPGNGGDPRNSGIIQLQLAPSGSFSCSLVWQGHRYPFHGRLAGDGTFSRTISKGAATRGGVVLNTSLLVGHDGDFYGTAYFGGANGIGTVFRMTPEGAVTNLVNFSGAKVPSRVFDLERIIDLLRNRESLPQTVINKVPFASGLVQGSDGYFYGTTQQGGRYAAGAYGTIYRMTSGGRRETLVNFRGNNPKAKGAAPQAALIEGSDGDFYGTTEFGDFHGTVFKLTPSGEFTTLVTFTGDKGENPGSHPFGALVEGPDGNFYGTTREGGADGQGTIFKTTPSGTFTTLVQFTGNGATNKGSSPGAGLLLASDGNFYGTTESGGANDLGTVFRLVTNGTAAGTTLTTLVEFTGTTGVTRGSLPVAALVEGSAGVFYGVTGFGSIGTKAGDRFTGNGTAFKVTSAGAFETLVDFTDDVGPNKGSNPSAALVRGEDGNFYGTTSGGGANFAGTIFRVTPAGALTTLVEFNNSPEKITVSFALNSPSRTISGTLTDTTPGGASAEYAFALDGAVPSAALTDVYQPGTRISFIAPPNPSTDSDTEPPPTTTNLDPTPIFGDGFMQVTVGRTNQRLVRVVGRLPDYDGVFSSGAPLRGVSYALYGTLYRQQAIVGGSLFGMATVTAAGDSANFEADLRWSKPEGFDPDYYFGEINRSVHLQAVPYPKLAKSSLPPLVSDPGDSLNAHLSFRRGNLRLPNNAAGNDLFFGVDLAISRSGAKVISSNPQDVTIKINARSGSFQGTFVHPVFGTKTNFQGAFQPADGAVPGIGRGSFRPQVKADALPTLTEPLVSGGVTLVVD